MTTDELDPEGELSRAVASKLAVVEDGSRLRADEELYLTLDAFVWRLSRVLLEEEVEDAENIDGIAEHVTVRLGARRARLVAFLHVLPCTSAPIVVDYDVSSDGTTFERVEVGFGWAATADRRFDSKALSRFQNDPWTVACGVCLRWK